MKIKIMTQEAVTYIKKNISEFVDYYINGLNPEEWIPKHLGKKGFVETVLEIPDIDLEINEHKPASTDVVNIKKFYKATKDINDSFATDERLWAGLSHTYFYEYMISRWSGKLTADSILNHFFYKQVKPRAYMSNTLARCYWIGKKTYNEENDTFDVLDYVAHDINGLLYPLFGSNWPNSEFVFNQFFAAVFKYEEKTGEKVIRQLFLDLIKYTNGLCGTYCLDTYSKDELTSQLLNYLENRAEEAKADAERNKLMNIRKTGIGKLDDLILAINKIGGVGTQRDILLSLADLYGTMLSEAQKETVKNYLIKYSPSGDSDKIIFHRIEINNQSQWKVANDYLTTDNLEKRKKYIEKIINSLVGIDKTTFNFVSAFKSSKFSIDMILEYKTQLQNMYPEIENIERMIKEGIKSLYAKGIIEKIDKNSYKKAYILNN